MQALPIAANETREFNELHPAEAIDPKDFAYYVYLADGTVQEVSPATELRFTGDTLVFLLGEFVIARLSRRDVYCATRQATDAPALV
jgi:hypothetical protein